MAGMEELEIHSKSYLVRWVNVKGEHTISWSIQPHKRSINFGIFKHLGQPTPSNSSATTTTINADSQSVLDLPSDNAPASAVIEKLRSAGLKPTQWIGKCEADKISQGTYDVPLSEGGNYALVFDNTFSKTTGKMATFVLVTYPTATPPQSVHQVHPPHALGTVNNIGAPGNRVSPKLRPTNASNTSIDNPRPTGKGGRSVSGGKSMKQRRKSNSVSSINGASGLVHTGILQKRRRKRHQGWARRFFSLDYTSSTLSYYHDRNSSALRGAIPLNLAAVAANADRREISIDSGAEIWHLRANNESDFAAWRAALERASKQSKEDKTARPASPTLQIPANLTSRGLPNPDEDREWEVIESLVSKISGSRDAVRRLAKDTDPKYLTSSASSAPIATLERRRSPSPHLQASPADGSPINGEDYFGDAQQKRPFWKRKTSGNNTPSSTSAKRQPNGTTHLATPSPSNDAFPVPVPEDRKARSVVSHHTDHDEDIHENLMAILRDLDKTVIEFTNLIAESKERRHPQISKMSSRASLDSEASQEFFDAEAGPSSPLLTIQHDSDVEAENEDEEEHVDDDALSSCSEGDTRSAYMRRGIRKESSAVLFPAKPKSLIPLPLDGVQRRNVIPAPTVPPPSLIGFLRKNVGKDLSAVSMPVTANEPLSLLQRAAECMEYSPLLDKAASAIDGLERLVYVTAFALSSLSSNRVKDRAIRKPFNPLLGETFELVREDRGFRMIVEKVSHRPVQLAYQADSRDWSLAQSPKPTQKFWGKSAEIHTDGKTRLSLHSSGDHFSWGSATSFLRNIIAGEKYVEPVGEMVVVNETTGQKTITTFKAGGMFSGRSEEVTVKAFDVHGNELPLGLTGTWTNSLQLTEHGSSTNKTIWSVGPLVDQATKRYGFPVFAATLNETTPIEQGKLPPTDSRLRPDQRALENNDVDTAEDLKAKLEEKQRERRKELEEIGGVYKPRWFSKVDTSDVSSTSGGNGGGSEEVVWKLKSGKDGYWEERGRGEWNGVVPIFKL